MIWLLLAAAAQEPEGFGERWIRYDSGWTWRAGEGLSGESGRVRLRSGEWFLAERGACDAFRWKGPVRVYALDRGGLWIGRASDPPGAPPAGRPLLAVELSGSPDLRGWTWARLDPLALGEWIAARAEEDGELELQGLEPRTSPEAWERFERRARGAVDPSARWPAELESDLSVRLPGHDVGRLARRWRIALPNPPAADDAAARSLRIAWLLLESPKVRDPAFTHQRRSVWGLDGETVSDAAGDAWTRLETPAEREVEGPAVVRVRARGQWDLEGGGSSATRAAAVRVGVGGETIAFRRARGPDLEFSDGLRRVWTSPAETRVAVPPGVHKVRVAAEGEGWVAVETWVRIHQGDLRRPESYLVEPSGRPDLKAVRALLEGRPEEALELLEGVEGPWAAVRGLETAARLGRREASLRFDARIPWDTLAGPLATEARIAGLRLAIERGLPAEADRHAEALLRDPLATPEDCSEALLALDASGATVRPGRAWAVADDPLHPRVLRRMLLDFDLETARARAARWHPLVPAVADAAALRRWAEVVGFQSRRGRPDALWEAWARFRASGDGGTWRASTAEEARFRAASRGTVELLPLERRPLAVPLALVAGERPLGLARLNDPAAPFALAWSGAEAGAEGRAEGGEPGRVLLWRGRALEWPAGGPWLSLLHANAPAATAPAEFATLGGAGRGIGRLLVEIPETAADVDAPFEASTGARPLLSGRLLRIGAGDPAVVAARLLLPAAAVRVRVVAPPGAVVGLDERLYRATPAPLFPDDYGGLEARRCPPSGIPELLAAPLKPADPREVEADGRRAIAESGAAKGEALLRRAERLAASDLLDEAERDLAEAEAAFAALDVGSEGAQLARIRLAALAFERGRFADLRVKLRRILATGGGSAEAYLLAAGSALAAGDAASADAWTAAALRHPSPRPPDLERVLAAALGQEEAPRAGDGFLDVVARLLRLRHLSRRVDVPGFLRELEAAGVAIDDRSRSELRSERSERLRRWRAETEIAAAAVRAPGAWPPPAGVLDPLAVLRDVTLDPAGSGAREATMIGEAGFRSAWWMAAGDEIRLPVVAPGWYELEWRSGFAEGAALAAPARFWIRGLSDGPAVRAVCAGGPARELSVPGLPGVVPGTSDRRRFALAAGEPDEVRLRLMAGAGFVTLRTAVARAESAWGGLGLREATPAAPPARAPRPADPRAEEDPRLDLDRRLRILEGADEAAREAFADDLLFLALERPEQVDDEEILRALVTYEGLPRAPHRDRHLALAASLTRWRYADLSDRFPEIRQAHTPLEASRSEEGAIRAALFLPLWDGLIFDSLNPVEWRHEAPRPEFVKVEVVADASPPGSVPEPVVRLEVDGLPAAEGVLEPGRPRVFPLSLPGDTLLVARVRGQRPDALVRARLRVLDEAGRPYRPSSGRVTLHRPGARPIEAAFLGPTVVRFEAWPESKIARAAGDAWEATGLPAEETRLLEGRGTALAAFTPPEGKLFRVGARVADVDAWRRRLAATPKPPVPGQPPREEPARPQESLDERPAPAAREMEGVPGLYEAFATGEYRGRSRRRELDEEDGEDQIVVGGRFHVGGPELFARLTVAEIVPDNQPLVSYGELRLHHYFLDNPDLDARLIAEGWTQTINGESEASWETRLRLRWRTIAIGDQADLFLSNEVALWDGTLGRDGVGPILEDVYRRLWNEYREEHRRWDLWELRIRYFPYQNVVVEPWGYVRTNEDFSDPDRWAGGLDVKAHLEEWFADVGFRYIFRFKDDDRASDDDETGLSARLGWQGWLGAGTWLSVELSGAWIGPGDAAEFGFGLVLRYGGPRGERLSEVDPEVQRFREYHDATYPWRRP